LKRLSYFICILAALAALACEPFLFLFYDILGSVSENAGIYAACALHTQKTFSDDFTLLSRYTTYFDNSNTERTHNIALAAKKLDKTVICAGECFSFNDSTGARTEENGYMRARVIEYGKFVLGVGGGVCQVSTTVYNAAVLAGLEVVELHAHSLQVGYVPPSRDAMVSGTSCDLKLKNLYATRLLMRTRCGEGYICCEIYGKSGGKSYSFISKEVAPIPRPAAILVEGEEEKVISFGRDGLISEGYVSENDGVNSKVYLVRRDSYLAIPDVLQTKPAAQNSAK